MKIFSFIFSFYILFLALQPGITALGFAQGVETYCCGNTSCEPGEMEQPGDDHEEKGCDETSFCNPFQTCSHCVAHTSDLVCINLSPIIILSDQHAVNKENALPAVSLDFWQPPKLS